MLQLLQEKGKKMAESCGCYEEEKAKRKNRSKKKRIYTIADLNRISVYVNRDEKMQPLFIIAELAYFHGYGTMFCQVSRLIDKITSAATVLQPILTFMVTSKLLKALLTFAKLIEGGLSFTGFGIAMLAVTILIEKFSSQLLGWFEYITGDATIQTLKDDSHVACAYLRSKYGDADFADDAFEFDLTNELAEVYANNFDFDLTDLFPTGSMKP